VIDAIDQVQVKIALIEFCLNNKIRFVTTGGAGGRVDPQKVMIEDLKNTHGDKLIAKVRQHFNKLKAKKKIPVVFSPEVLKKPEACDSSQLNGLGCEGYGSSMNVTATFGFFASAYAMNHL
jgi:tRNA A37 threonylcarbamoyladenosine dehydratase